MAEDFEIEVDDQTAPDYSVDTNIAENLVDVVRSEIVGNERQFLATNAVYASGLSPDPDSYIQLIIRGKSGEGKTKLKQTVDSVWPKNWLLRAKSTSDQGLVDDSTWNEVYVGAFAELQQMQGKMLEMVKASSGDDADEGGVGFKHTRNVDNDGERDSKDIEKQSMPTVFLFADENNTSIPRELETRQMTVRVEADSDLNRAVAKTMFDHKEVEVDGREHNYNFNFDEGKRAVTNHIANIPRPNDVTMADETKSYARPVVIPHDESIDWPINDHPTIDSYGWDAFEVLAPVLSYNKTESKRGAKTIANHIRSWARLNYHSRETMVVGDTEYIVAEPQDVANVLAYRDLLLNVTHNINEQKLAVIEALTDEHNGVGGMGPNGGYWAPHKDIRKYIDEYASITSLSKSQLTNSQNSGVLDQMEEDYLIEVHEGEGENGAHMYEFLGGSTFGHPNLDVYDELFSECTDPITGEPIAKTVAEFEAELSTQTTDDIWSGDVDTEMPETTTDDEQSESGGLSDFTDDEDDSDVEWTEVDCAVAERLRETIDDYRIRDEDKQQAHVEHLLGISPVEYYTDDRGIGYVRAERPRQESDKKDTIMDPTHPMWGDKSQGQVESAIENSVAKLRANDVFRLEDEPDENAEYVIIEEIGE